MFNFHTICQLYINIKYSYIEIGKVDIMFLLLRLEILKGEKNNSWFTLFWHLENNGRTQLNQNNRNKIQQENWGKVQLPTLDMLLIKRKGQLSKGKIVLHLILPEKFTEHYSKDDIPTCMKT